MHCSTLGFSWFSISTDSYQFTTTETVTCFMASNWFVIYWYLHGVGISKTVLITVVQLLHLRQRLQTEMKDGVGVYIVGDTIGHHQVILHQIVGQVTFHQVVKCQGFIFSINGFRPSSPALKTSSRFHFKPNLRSKI